MIVFVKGVIESIYEDRVIIHNNSIGYGIFVPKSIIPLIGNIGEEIKLYTYLHVKEDLMKLYGFLALDDLNVFKLLLGVSGIGPKGALAILSTMSTNELRLAVFASDAKAISKSPGVGAKTAQRLIIELKDKLDILETLEDYEAHGVNASDGIYESVKNDAIEALTTLGYSATDSLRAINKVSITEDMDVEDVLKAALKKIM